MLTGVPPGLEIAPPVTTTAAAPARPLDAPWADEPGGFWRRLFAFIVDAGLVWLLLRLSRLATLLLASRPLIAQAFFVAWALVIPAAYFVVLHGTGGQTLGKWLLGVRVVTARGEPVGYLRALLRLIGWLASALLMFLGHLVVPARADRRAAYDHLAGTRVVRVRRAALL